MTDKELEAFITSCCIISIVIVAYSIGQDIQTGNYLLIIPALFFSMPLLYVIYKTTINSLIQKELNKV